MNNNISIVGGNNELPVISPFPSKKNEIENMIDKVEKNIWVYHW